MCGDLIPLVTDEGTTCVDPDAAVTTTLSPSELEWPGADFWEGTIPPLLVASGTTISLLTYDEDDKEAYAVEPLLETPHPVVEIRQASDGTIFTQELIEDDIFGTTAVAVYRPSEPRVVVDDSSRLYDVAVVDGVESVILGLVRPIDAELEGTGHVVARSTTDLEHEVIDFDLYSEALLFVDRVDYADGTLVYSGFSDLTEIVGYRGMVPDGAYSPTDELQYNAPPRIQGASLSDDGETLYWILGNDFDPTLNDSEGGYSDEPWTLMGADVATGEVSLVWPMTESRAGFWELSFESTADLGDQILVNRLGVQGLEAGHLTAVVLDFTYEEPWLRELPIAGVATPAAT